MTTRSRPQRSRTAEHANTPAPIAAALLAWYDRHGRKDLPWQRDRDPYRIWVSEIMLQQTQVATVIPYFERFVARFGDVSPLAAAPVDEVLHLWTGLGYYARARHLHRAARVIVDDHHGRFPREIDALQALPGIGRSTAGAILAFAHGQRHPILDGNVKRVLTRYHRIEQWPGQRAVEQRLWQLADAYTPDQRVGDYTQAMMDLGATVCRRSRPLCTACPLRDGCIAQRAGDPERYPARAPARAKPVRAVCVVMVRDGDGHVLLERRPPAGVWGGLWGFPECEPHADIAAVIADRYALAVALESPWPCFRHTFSHFHLDITPVPARVHGSLTRAMENRGLVWYNPRRPDARGLAAPVKRLLEKLR